VRGDALDQGEVGGSLQVKTDALFAAVEPHKVARLAEHGIVVAAREVALGTLDLDDAGAEVGELAGGERGGDSLFQA